jgi:hypothetical protein
VPDFLVSRAAVEVDRQTGYAWDNRLSRRTAREYHPNLGINIRCLVVDAWLPISWASVTFLRSLRTLVLYTFDRVHFSNCTRTEISYGFTRISNLSLSFLASEAAVGT